MINQSNLIQYFEKISKRKKIHSYEELSEKIKFEFMRELISSKLYDNEDYLMKIYIEYNDFMMRNKMKNIQIYQMINFKNILLKYSNMRIYYHQIESDKYEIFISYNLNSRLFKNEKKIMNEKEMKKLINKFRLEDYKMKKEREMKIS